MREDERLWALSTVEQAEAATRRARAATEPPPEPMSAEPRLESRLAEGDGRLALFYGPI